MTNQSILHRFFLVILCTMPALLFAQYEAEREDMAPMPIPESERQTSLPFTISSPNFFATQVNVDANGMNILNDAANEPSMAIDPTNPNRIAIGWRQFDNIQSNFRQAGFAYSIDGGQTWVGEGVIKPGIFRSDPVLVSDAQGRFYYNSLDVDDTQPIPYSCFVHRADSMGQWDDGVFAQGGDKQWMTIDNTNGVGEGNIYSNWNESFSICEDNDYTRSTNGGDSYDDCLDMPGGIRWGNIHVGPDGTVYVPGHDGRLAVSVDAKDASVATTWDLLDVDMGGRLSTGGANPSGLLGQMWVDSDHSTGTNGGNIYMAATVRPFQSNDPGDFMFNRSTDNANSWDNPVRVNDDTGNNWQWMGVMSVAPNGRIDAAWLDSRDNPNSVLSALYYSFSLDGGLTWSVNEKLSDSFDPHVGWPMQEKMGDYFHMYSDNDGASLAWCGTFNGEQDVYFGRISQNVVSNQIPTNTTISVQNSPNPFISTTRFTISGEKGMSYSLAIFNQMGKKVHELHGLHGERYLDWDGKNAAGVSVENGVYYARVQFENGAVQSVRVVKMGE